MDQPEDASLGNVPEHVIVQDATFQEQVQRLHRLSVYRRWAVIIGSCLIIAPPCLWALRDEIALWHEYFTWAALRYGLADHPLATIGLAWCLGIMLSTLLWQSRNIIWGLSKRDRQQLEQQVCQIRQQGSSHPLWKYICRS
jgi:hypothetical protein